MATQAHYLITRTVNDVGALLLELERANTTITRIVQRMAALGLPALVGYEWPEGYTQADFVALYQNMIDLPDSVVSDAVRDALFKLVSFVQ